MDVITYPGCVLNDGELIPDHHVQLQRNAVGDLTCIKERLEAYFQTKNDGLQKDMKWIISQS